MLVSKSRTAVGSEEWSFDEVRRFEYLYRRASSDLVKMRTFAAHSELQAWLENLVAHSYSKLHEERRTELRFSVWDWLSREFPRTVRIHWRAIMISLLCFAAGLFADSPSSISVRMEARFAGAFFDPGERSVGTGRGRKKRSSSTTSAGDSRFRAASSSTTQKWCAWQWWLEFVGDSHRAHPVS